MSKHPYFEKYENVLPFFKNNVQSNWTLTNFLNEQLAKNSQVPFKTIKSAWQNSLNHILKIDEVPNAIKTEIGRMLKDSRTSGSNGGSAGSTTNIKDNIIISSTINNNIGRSTKQQKRKRDDGTRKSNRLNTKLNIQEGDSKLPNTNDTAGSRIKQHAYDLYKDKEYHSLDIGVQVSICLGFGSILDLSIESDNKFTQRSLFNDTEWKYLKETHKQEINWSVYLLGRAIQDA